MPRRIRLRPTAVYTPPTTGTNEPSIVSLPLAVAGGADWNTFPGTSWAVNAAWEDSTGVTLRRLTNSSTLTSNTRVNFVYGTAGPRISRPWGPNSDQYWMIVYVWGVGTKFVAYQRGVGIDNGSWRDAPIADSGNLYYAFGAEPHICYISDGGSPGQIRRYNVNTQAYEAHAIFNGANASISAGGNNPAWLQTSWDGTRLVYQTPIVSPTAVHHLDLTTGTLTTYSGAQMSGVNEIKMFKGTDKIVGLAMNDNTWRFWFVDQNRVTATASGTRSGHSDAGSAACFARDPDASEAPWSRTTPGTVPGADAGAWNGARTNLVNTAAACVIQDENYPASQWDQTGNATEYMPIGAFGISTEATPGSWSVHSGSIYTCTVTFGGYQASSRGVTAVLRSSSPGSAGATIQGHLTRAASLGAMTAGTWFASGATLYVWMADSTTPSGKVVVQAAGKLDHSVGYISADASDVRKLCYTYRNETTFAYDDVTRANWSPDGKVCVFATNFGVDGGRVDLIAAEVPVV